MPKKKNTVRADGRIAVQVYIGRREDGTRQYKTVYGTTQKEADEKALQVKLAIRKGIDIAAEKETFGEWADLWMLEKLPTVSESWGLVYKSCLDKLSSLRSAPIARLKPADFQRILTELAQQNSSTGKPASMRILQALKSTASQICRFAIENRIMDYNPLDFTHLPASRPALKRRALTDEERTWIEATPHRAQIAAMIMMYAGLRRGELIALTWQDIDLMGHTITVSKSVEMIHGQPALKSGGKTENSTRVVDIPKRLVDYLAAQPKKAMLVCPSSKGSMLSAEGWKRLWESFLFELNIQHGDFRNCIQWKNGRKLDGHLITEKDRYSPHGVPMAISPFTAHDLRHTFATLLYFSGVDILTAKEQLGHADVKTTMEIYTHLDRAYKRRSMEKLDGYLEDASQVQVK